MKYNKSMHFQTLELKKISNNIGDIKDYKSLKSFWTE